MKDNVGAYGRIRARKKEKQIEIAKRLIENDVDIEIIINSTGLTYDEIKK